MVLHMLRIEVHEAVLVGQGFLQNCSVEIGLDRGRGNDSEGLSALPFQSGVEGALRTSQLSACAKTAQLDFNPEGLPDSRCSLLSFC